MQLYTSTHNFTLQVNNHTKHMCSEMYLLKHTQRSLHRVQPRLLGQCAWQFLHGCRLHAWWREKQKLIKQIKNSHMTGLCQLQLVSLPLLGSGQIWQGWQTWEPYQHHWIWNRSICNCDNDKGLKVHVLAIPLRLIPVTRLRRAAGCRWTRLFFNLFTRPQPKPWQQF